MRPAFAATLLALVSPTAASAAGEEGGLRFEVTEGRNINAFVRDGPVAAHLLLRSGAEPRILVALPAGNSGVGLWFEPTGMPVRWSLDAPPRPITLADDEERPLHGIVAEATAVAPSLAVRRALLSSVRVLREYESTGETLATLQAEPVIDGNRMTWTRDRLDGAAGYHLSVELLDGTIQGGKLIAAPDGTLRLRIVAATGETPLTPLHGDALLTDEAADDRTARNALEFLSYREKFLAGSWRFNTYFGRDTLMSLRLLMPVLQPPAIEAGLRSVLVRLARNGEVAHEEDIGEYAVLRRLREDGTASDAPIYDYAMIDDDFMLAPVAAAWLLDDPRGRARAADFLAEAGPALVRNLRFVVERADPFAADPVAANLLGLKEGRAAGQWRDSSEGLGRGRYPFDVNAVFVPAALDAAARLLASGLLDPHLREDDREILDRASASAMVWRAKAPPLFAVAIHEAEASAAVRAYAEALAIPSVPVDSTLAFPALALDAEGRPIPVLHSDIGFAMLFGDPSPASLDAWARAIMRRFPAGLMTNIGLLVANPAFAGREVWPRFDRNAYHGAVVWSWQQAVLAAGLDRQLRRADLPADVRARLGDAQQRLWSAIEAADAVRTSELWSWTWAGGRFSVAPFGADSADEDESNAAQLWSTVFLALDPPRKED